MLRLWSNRIFLLVFVQFHATLLNKRRERNNKSFIRMHKFVYYSFVFVSGILSLVSSAFNLCTVFDCCFFSFVFIIIVLLPYMHRKTTTSSQTKSITLNSVFHAQKPLFVLWEIDIWRKIFKCVSVYVWHFTVYFQLQSTFFTFASMFLSLQFSANSHFHSIPSL